MRWLLFIPRITSYNVCYTKLLRHPFTDLREGYWASTTSVYETDWSWVLYLDKGALGVGYKPEKTFYVWLVGVNNGKI